MAKLSHVDEEGQIYSSFLKKMIKFLQIYEEAQTKPVVMVGDHCGPVSLDSLCEQRFPETLSAIGERRKDRRLLLKISVIIVKYPWVGVL